MDAVFRALADANRRELLDRLRADNGQTLGQLCERLDMTRQAVSKHLAIHEIAERWLGKFERSRLQALSDMKKALEVDHE
jgi:DNA-binding transcriptional ArsR family regulator